MKEYEVIREIFNSCSNNQMRDVFVEEIETDDPKAWVMNGLAGKDIHIEESIHEDGVIVYDVIIANLHQRFTFTPF